MLTRTTAFGYHDDNFVVAVERRTNHLGAAAPTDLARERLWRIRAGRVVLATGAHERPIAFANNDLPGVMLAGAAQTYAVRYGVRPGNRAVVFTNNDSAYAAAVDLVRAGVAVVAIIDTRRHPPAARDSVLRDTALLAGHVVLSAEGPGSVESVVATPVEGGRPTTLPVDLLAVSGGWNPVVQLFAQSGGTLRVVGGDRRLRPAPRRASGWTWSVPRPAPASATVDPLLVRRRGRPGHQLRRPAA